MGEKKSDRNHSRSSFGRQRQRVPLSPELKVHTDCIDVILWLSNYFTEETGLCASLTLSTLQAELTGFTIVGGRVEMGGRSEEAVLRAFWMRSWSMMTRLAMASTMGTARGTTQGSCLPRAARVPGVPSYWAVSCACEMVAGDLNPTLI